MFETQIIKNENEKYYFYISFKKEGHTHQSIGSNGVEYITAAECAKEARQWMYNLVFMMDVLHQRIEIDRF